MFCRKGTILASGLLVGVLLVISRPKLSQASSDNEKEPSAEPYSFSYNAESVGGFSSHQESGDGTGRVQGFYIIMGDDNRERRVDYVADENGYRASISTNEVGTRSESSADAQYNARLPSKEQLDQAKVTAEEYKFLEDQHAAERDRHLNRNGQQVQPQQQQQQQQKFNQNSQRWSPRGATNQVASQSSSMSSGSVQRWTPTQAVNLASQYEQAPNFTSTSTSVTNESDEGWRSAKLLLANEQQQQQSEAANLKLKFVGSNQANQIQSSQFATMNQQQEQQKPFSQQQRLMAINAASLDQEQPSSSFSSKTSGALSIEPAVSSGPIVVSQGQPRQQTQQSNVWRPSGKGTSSIKTSSNPGLQQQLEQQFMQQSSQLAAQDYPRQPSQPNTNFEGQLQLQRQPTDNVATQQPQLQQLVQQPQQRQPQQQSMFVDEPVSLSVTNVASQLPQWQANINLADSRPQSQDYSQINQQQNNIIDEVSGEQVDNQPATAGPGPDYARETNQSYTTVSSINIKQVEPIKTSQLVIPMQQQQQAVEQSYKPYQSYETTTSQPAPSGFLAINLGQQEADMRVPQQTLITDYQTPTYSGQRVDEQDAQQRQPGADYQAQVFVDQQQQQQRPMSIQEIIQTGQRQQGIKQKQQEQQQQEFLRPTIVTTTPGLVITETTTTQEPTELTTTFQPIIVTTRAPVESTVRTTPSTTTTSTTTSQRPVVVKQQEQYYTTTSAPTRNFYAPTSVAPVGGGFSGLLEQKTRRPTPVVKQQQQLIGGVKGMGKVGPKRVVAGPKYATTPARPVEQNLARETPTIPMTTTTTTTRAREEYTTTTTSPVRPSYQQAVVVPTQKPELIADRQTKQQQQQQQKPLQVFETPKTQQAPYQQPETYPNYNSQQPIVATSENATTIRPAIKIETNSSQRPKQQPQQQSQKQQQKQQWKGGIKGTDKVNANKRQFWQQPTAASNQRASFQVNTQQPTLSSVNQKSQASVDYATSLDYGTRIQGR